MASNTLDLDAIKQKLAQEKQNPEEAAKLDSSIRANRASVGARAMVEAVKAAHRRLRVQTLTSEMIEADSQLKTFQQAFPRLFAMVNDPAHSPAILFAMLDQLTSVERGAKSTHDASVATGTILVNSFVRPKLGMEPVPLPNSETPPAHP